MTEQFGDGEVVWVSENGREAIPWVKRSRIEALMDRSEKPTGTLPGSDIPTYDLFTPNPNEQCDADIIHEVTSDATICGRARISCPRCGIVSVGYDGLGNNGNITFFPRAELSTNEFLSKNCPRWKNFRLEEGNSPLSQELGLPARPREVLDRLLQGQDRPQISGEMSIKPRTLQGHLNRIHRAFGVRSTTQAIAKAVQLGFEVSYPKGDKLEGQSPFQI